MLHCVFCLPGNNNYDCTVWCDWLRSCVMWRDWLVSQLLHLLTSFTSSHLEVCTCCRCLFLALDCFRCWFSNDLFCRVLVMMLRLKACRVWWYKHIISLCIYIEYCCVPNITAVVLNAITIQYFSQEFVISLAVKISLVALSLYNVTTVNSGLRSCLCYFPF